MAAGLECSSSSDESLCSDVEIRFSEGYTSGEDGERELVLLPSTMVSCSTLWESSFWIK